MLCPKWLALQPDYRPCEARVCQALNGIVILDSGEAVWGMHTALARDGTECAALTHAREHWTATMLVALGALADVVPRYTWQLLANRWHDSNHLQYLYVQESSANVSDIRRERLRRHISF